MLKLFLKGDKVERLNLRNPDLEVRVYQRIHSMIVDGTLGDKLLKLQTDKGEKTFKVGDLEKCRYEDAVYCDGSDVRNIKDRKKEKQQKEKTDDTRSPGEKLYDWHQKHKGERAKRNLNAFAEGLKSQGIDVEDIIDSR